MYYFVVEYLIFSEGKLWGKGDILSCTKQEGFYNPTGIKNVVTRLIKQDNNEINIVVTISNHYSISKEQSASFQGKYYRVDNT